MKIPIPREHGTWAMIYVPIAIAFASAPHLKVDFLILLFAMTSMFFLRNPLETLIRLRMKGNSASMHKHSLFWIFIFGALALACGSYLFLRGFKFLLIFFISFVLLLAVHLFMQLRRQDHGKLSELIAIAGLTSSGLATRGVLTGTLDQEGFLLWMLCFLYFSSSVFYIKMRISRQRHNKESDRSTWLCTAFHIVLVLILATLALYKLIPTYTAAAYVPIVIRAFLGTTTSEKINLKRVGIAEVVYTVIFASILIFAEVLSYDQTF